MYNVRRAVAMKIACMYMSSHALSIAKHYVLGDWCEFKVEVQACVQLPMCAQQKPEATLLHQVCTPHVYSPIISL